MTTTRSIRSAALVIAAIAAGAGSPVDAQERMDAQLEAFAAEVDSLRQALRIPGLSVAVVRDGRVVLARGFGWADVEARVPATEHTPYNIASVTKTISGVVAMRLVERGILDLDRPMSSFAHWAEFCAEARADGPRIFFADYDCSPRVTLRHVLSMQMNGTAGERFYYNPISFSWASRPIMQAAGRPFSDLVAEEVFAPGGDDGVRAQAPRPAAARGPGRGRCQPYHVDSAGAFVRSPEPGPQGDGAAGA